MTANLLPSETNCCFTPKRDVPADNATGSPHLEVLPGGGQRTAASPFTEVERIPSTHWEETFPSARRLTAQCHNYTNVFTP